MAAIAWLHLSDLHFNDVGAETDLMREKLIAYVSSLSKSQAFSYFFLTGDIRNAPDHDYPLDAIPYLERILRAAHVPSDNFFLVPGNHDIERDALGRGKTICKVLENYDPKKGIIAADDLCLLKGERTEYLRLLQPLLPSKRADKYGVHQPPHFVEETEHLNVIHLDSTLVYDAEHESNLIIGSYPFSKVIQECNPDKPAVILSHYSFDNIRREEQDILLAWMKHQNIQLWLAGHEHRDIVRKQRDWFFEIQSGNLNFADRTAPGFVVGTLDTETGHGSFQVHRWNHSADWALYQTLSDKEDRTTYPFELQWAQPKPDPILDVSRRQLQMHCSRGGRFYCLELKNDLLPLVSENTVSSEAGLEPLPLSRILAEQIAGNDFEPILLLGEGGSGKSCSVLAAWKRLLENKIPTFYFPLYELTEDGPSIEQRLKDIVGQVLSSAFEGHTSLLVLDGFNEQRPNCIFRTIQSIRRLMRMGNIKLVITSRYDFRTAYALPELRLFYTLALSESQIKRLLSNISVDMESLSPPLRKLIGNPMMAILYFQMTPLAQRYQDISWVNWRRDINCAEDLLQNFFQIQSADLLRQDCSGDEIFKRCFVIDHVLPGIAALAASKGIMELTADEMEDFTKQVLGRFCEKWVSDMPSGLQRIRRELESRSELPDAEEVHQILTKRLHFLSRCGDAYTFQHQIYQDYLCARYYCSIFNEWHDIPAEWSAWYIPERILASIRNMTAEPWAEAGVANRFLAACRDLPTALPNRFLKNTLDCWMPSPCGSGQIRDLSELDFRHFSLAPYLQRPISGKIRLSKALVSQGTFSDVPEHDKICSLAFSADDQLIGIASHNGLLSVYDRSTNERIFAENTGRRWGRIFFDKNNRLKGTDDTEGEDKDVPHRERIDQFLSVLDKEKKTGSATAYGRSRPEVAIGHTDGSVDIWDCEEQIQVLHISVGVRQTVCAAVSFDGHWLAVGAGSQLVQIWDLAKLAYRGCAYLERPVTQLRFDWTDRPERLFCSFADQSGAFYDCAKMSLLPDKQSPERPHFNREKIERVAGTSAFSRFDTSPSGSAVALLADGARVITWNQREGQCHYHNRQKQPILDAALCRRDDRFAASYADEVISAAELRRISDSKRKAVLAGQRVIRVWHTSTGQSVIRLPTAKRRLKRIRFFSNGIQLVGFSKDHQILVWELTNEQWYGGTKEVGRWSSTPITVPGRSDLPLECALLQAYYKFVLIYPDASVVVWDIKSRHEETFQTIPGISFDALDISDVVAETDVLQLLSAYSKGLDA